MSTISLTINMGTLSTDIIYQSRQEELCGSHSFTPSGWELVEAVLEYLKTNRKLLVARLSAVQVITYLGSAVEPIEIKYYQVVGRSLITGMPHRLDVTSKELFEILLPYLEAIIFNIVNHIKLHIALLESDVVVDNNIKLTGDFRYLRQLNLVLEKVISEILIPNVSIEVMKH